MSFTTVSRSVLGGFSSIKPYFHPHYLTNIILAISFYVLKTNEYVCHYLFEDCRLELRELEMLSFLGCVIVLKNRKQPSYRDYIGTVCMFAKALNFLMYCQNNPIYGLLYAVIVLLHLVFLPAPSYAGPEYITYISGDDFEEEITRDRRITWLVEFFAPWSPQCVKFSQTFSELSAKYTLDNLKFAKVDVNRYPKVAKKYGIDVSSWSKQLPTVSLFQGGKEKNRRPWVDSNCRITKFIFSDQNIIDAFELNELYGQCKKHPLKKRTKGSLETVPDQNGEAGSAGDGKEKAE